MPFEMDTGKWEDGDGDGDGDGESGEEHEKLLN